LQKNLQYLWSETGQGGLIDPWGWRWKCTWVERRVNPNPLSTRTLRSEGLISWCCGRFERSDFGGNRIDWKCKSRCTISSRVHPHFPHLYAEGSPHAVITSAAWTKSAMHASQITR